MATYLYCRISQKRQNIERQKRNLKAAFPDGVIIEEAYTGTTTARPAWTRLYKKAAAGDTIAFDSVSRMSRNAEEGMTVYEELYSRGVNLVFLKEPHINTETYKASLSKSIPMTGGNVDFILEGVNRFLIELAKDQIRLAFEQSEKEVKDLQQRTKEGLQTARLNGKRIGAEKGRKRETEKAKASKKRIVELSQDFNGTNSDKDVMSIIGIAKNTYYKYKSELKEERERDAAADVAAILETP